MEDHIMATLVTNNSGLFPDLMNDFFADSVFFADPHTATAEAFIPKVNILETDNAFIIEMAVPGYAKEEIGMELNRNVLEVSAEVDTADDNKQFTKRQFVKRGFMKSFIMPEEVVDMTAISAKQENGVLLIYIPKREEEKPQAPRKIEIA